ncbi:MAG TPA: ATP-binding protein, partial [Hyphomicrobiaceae bacterium]|nr:ATP-binding protein [Hyphomicrobiaceae bacterium]
MTLAVDAAMPVMASVNRQLIGQAVANLVDNAVKYAKTGAGEAPSITVSARRAGDMAEIAVADRGPGIRA